MLVLDCKCGFYFTVHHFQKYSYYLTVIWNDFGVLRGIITRRPNCPQQRLQILEMLLNTRTTACAGEDNSSTLDHFVQFLQSACRCHEAKHMHGQAVVFRSTGGQKSIKSVNKYSNIKGYIGCGLVWAGIMDLDFEIFSNVSNN